MFQSWESSQQTIPLISNNRNNYIHWDIFTKGPLVSTKGSAIRKYYCVVDEKITTKPTDVSFLQKLCLGHVGETNGICNTHKEMKYDIISYGFFLFGFVRSYCEGWLLTTYIKLWSLLEIMSYAFHNMTIPTRRWRFTPFSYEWYAMEIEEFCAGFFACVVPLFF